MRTLISDLKHEIDHLKAGVKTAATTDSSNSNSVQFHSTVHCEMPSETNKISETSIPKVTTQAIEISKVIHDLNRRKCNVVVSGLPESAGINELDKRNDDLNQFTSLCEEHLDVKPAVSRLGCRRLGKLENYGGNPRRLLIMAALCNRGAIIFLPCSFLLPSIFFFFFSSPNLSGHRLDVYHTSTHGVALVRI